MDVAEILAELEHYRGTFPRDAVESAEANPDDMIPELLAVLERVSGNIQSIAAQPEYMLHIYAMYLLAQFREGRAYPLITQLVSGPAEVVDDVLGDVVTDDLCRILASVTCGDDSLIKSLIENENANEYVRDAALRALVILVACGEKPREEVISYFHELFTGKIKREYSVVWSCLVSCAADLYPEELYKEIEQCFRDDLIEPIFITLDSVQESLERGKEAALGRLKNRHQYSLVTDTIGDMAWWACFEPEEKTERKPRRNKKKLSRLLASAAASIRQYQKPMRRQKIGRNEPCPCGSGKKYKKCCLRKDEEKRRAVPLPSVVDETDVLDDLSNSVPDLVRSGRLEDAEAVGLSRFAALYNGCGVKKGPVPTVSCMNQ